MNEWTLKAAQRSQTSESVLLFPVQEKGHSHAVKSQAIPSRRRVWCKNRIILNQKFSGECKESTRLNSESCRTILDWSLKRHPTLCSESLFDHVFRENSYKYARWKNGNLIFYVLFKTEMFSGYLMITGSDGSHKHWKSVRLFLVQGRTL